VVYLAISALTDSNYANIFSVWDRLFETYTPDVDFETLRYGLEAPVPNATARGRMPMPPRSKAMS